MPRRPSKRRSASADSVRAVPAAFHHVPPTDPSTETRAAAAASMIAAGTATADHPVPRTVRRGNSAGTADSAARAAARPRVRPALDASVALVSVAGRVRWAVPGLPLRVLRWVDLRSAHRVPRWAHRSRAAGHRLAPRLRVLPWARPRCRPLRRRPAPRLPVRLRRRLRHLPPDRWHSARVGQRRRPRPSRSHRRVLRLRRGACLRPRRQHRPQQHRHRQRRPQQRRHPQRLQLFQLQRSVGPWLQ